MYEKLKANVVPNGKTQTFSSKIDQEKARIPTLTTMINTDCKF